MNKLGDRSVASMLKRPDNKGADQSALPRSLFSAFVIRYIESIVVVKLAACKILILKLVSVAE